MVSTWEHVHGRTHVRAELYKCAYVSKTGASSNVSAEPFYFTIHHETAACQHVLPRALGGFGVSRWSVYTTSLKPAALPWRLDMFTVRIITAGSIPLRFTHHSPRDTTRVLLGAAAAVLRGCGWSPTVLGECPPALSALLTDGQLASEPRGSIMAVSSAHLDLSDARSPHLQSGSGCVAGGG